MNRTSLAAQPMIGAPLPVYAPPSLFSLNEKVVRIRGEIEREVPRLAQTGSIKDDEVNPILDWSSQHMSVTKWSVYLKSEPDGKRPLTEMLKPAEELANPPPGMKDVAGMALA